MCFMSKLPQLPVELQNKKIAIFHHFFKDNCKGGGEKLILQIREYYGADLWVGGISWEAWGPEQAQKDKDFAGKVWDPRWKFVYLHKESKIPIWKHIKRQLFFLFSPKIKELLEYDIVIFSYGNISFVPERLKKYQKYQKQKKQTNFFTLF